MVLREEQGKQIPSGCQTLKEWLSDTVGGPEGFQGQSIEEVSSGQIYRALGLASCR